MEELELKVLTDPEEFSRCLTALQRHTGTAGDGYVQVNYYFDTPDFSLAAAHAMLRVRRKKNTLYLQYKNKRKRIGEMLLCQESEAELSDFPSKVNPSRYFQNAPDQVCGFVGELVTYRRDFTFPGAVVSLDENIYLGKTDYEIEIEGDAQAIQRVAAFLNPEGESKKGNGKFSRFMKAYKEYHRLLDDKGEAL